MEHHLLLEGRSFINTLVQSMAALAESEAAAVLALVPGSYAHFAHKRHLAGNTIEGHASRALCGVFFVPTQDHATLPQCPRCGEEYTRLPQ